MLTPFLHFHHGQCAEAIEVYKKAFNAQVNSVAYYRDNPEHDPATENPDHIMHASVTLNGHPADLCDWDNNPPDKGNIITLSMYLDTPEDVIRTFDALKEGAIIDDPPAPTFFTPMFAKLTDRFGIPWFLMAK